MGCSNRDYLLENRSKENKNVSYYYYAFNKETISIFPLLEKIKENNNIPIYIYEMDDPNNAARLKLRIFEVAIGNAYYFLIKKSNESSFFIFKINSLEIINLFEKSQLEKQRFQNGKPQEQQAFQSFLFKSKNPFPSKSIPFPTVCKFFISIKFLSLSYSNSTTPSFIL